MRPAGTLRNLVLIATLSAVLPWCSCTIGPRPTAYSDPPPTFQDSDLVGSWQAVYGGHEAEGGLWARMSGVEMLVLRADGMYQQVYNDGNERVQTGSWNTWSIERLPDGRVQVHLVGGRFYPLEIELGEDLADGTWAYHTYDDGTGHPLRLDGTEVILMVRALSAAPEEVYLSYPPVGDPDSPVVVTFQCTSTRDFAPTETPR